MAGERNRSIELIKYIESKGIEVNVGKNKARGNKGFFKFASNGKFRIDISKTLNENEIFSVLIHEYTHYVHYCYDSTLKSLDFIFEDFNEELEEELIKVTVEEIPKEFAKELYTQKLKLNDEIKDLASQIKNKYPEFRRNSAFLKLERMISNPFKYLLKYDRVISLDKIYSIEDIDKFTTDVLPIQAAYIKLKSKQRMLKRVNSRINRLNNYYNKPTELLARFVEKYFTSFEHLNEIAPHTCKVFCQAISSNVVPEFANLHKYLKG